jgi:hypothetical protein
LGERTFLGWTVEVVAHPPKKMCHRLLGDRLGENISCRQGSWFYKTTDDQANVSCDGQDREMRRTT